MDKRISFQDTKKVARLVKLSFFSGDGKRLTFLDTKKVHRPVKINFYTRDRK